MEANKLHMLMQKNPKKGILPAILMKVFDPQNYPICSSCFSAQSKTQRSQWEFVTGQGRQSPFGVVMAGDQPALF